MSAQTTSATWGVWSTYAFLAVDDAETLPQARRIAERILSEVDRTCSRFRTDSDLSRANAVPGAWVRVDPLLIEATRIGVEAARVTDGLVNPCLGRALISLGYDADLEVVQLRDAANPLPVPPDPQAWMEIAWTDDALRIPANTALDLGATAKAWASDLIANHVADRLGVNVAVSLGGDVAVRGPDGPSAWPVTITESADSKGLAAHVLCSGGLATSGTTVRRWRAGGVDVHHMIDPRTGLSARSSYRTVTALGHDCVAANTAATAALVLGDEARHWLESQGVTARLVSTDGVVSHVGDWPEEAAA